MPKIVVYKTCTGCGACIEKCGTANLILDKKTKLIKPDKGIVSTREFDDRIEYDVPGCAACRYCEIFCPVGAIAIEI
ncbi:MAG: 4Fe-4S dicluster domain-containing protein [Candidatus Bathyarchaeia archaeon]